MRRGDHVQVFVPEPEMVHMIALGTEGPAGEEAGKGEAGGKEGRAGRQRRHGNECAA